MVGYIIRFDDLSRYSDLDKWRELFIVCESYNIFPVVGVIPDVNDKNLFKGFSNSEDEFWSFIGEFKNKINIAIHGLHHENLSEFDYAGQYKIISNSLKVFSKYGIVPDIIIPPNHKFNKETISVMGAFGIGYLSDGVGIFPWKHIEQDVVHVPQIFWGVRKMPFGLYTFCYHPDTMNSSNRDFLFDFFKNNCGDFISIFDVKFTPLEVLNMPFRVVYNWLFSMRFGKTIPF